MLGLLPSIHCVVSLCTAAHVTAIDTTTYVLQLPLNLLHHAAHSTATTNYCTTTQLARSKKLKDSCPIVDRQVRLHPITETPLAAALRCLLEASVLPQLRIA